MVDIDDLISRMPELTDEQLWALHSAVAQEASRPKRRAVRNAKLGNREERRIAAKNARYYASVKRDTDRGERYWELRRSGKTVKQIAEEVGFSTGHVRNLMAHADFWRGQMEKLRERLAIADGRDA